MTETPYQGQASTTYYTTNSVNAYTQIGAEYRTHDANGNLTCDGTRYFGYDFKNNLVNVLTVASYEFDALNRRTKKYVNATEATTRCIYDGQSLIEEYDGSDNLIHLFVNGQQIDEPRVMIGPDYADVDGDQNTTEEVRLYFHADQVGSIVAVTGPDETVVEQYEYMPYGSVTIKDGQGTDLNGTSAILNPFMFTARRLDEETGLYQEGHRTLDPIVGRFVQRDDHGAGNNPYGGESITLCCCGGVRTETRLIIQVIYLGAGAAFTETRPGQDADGNDLYKDNFGPEEGSRPPATAGASQVTPGTWNSSDEENTNNESPWYRKRVYTATTVEKRGSYYYVVSWRWVQYFVKDADGLDYVLSLVNNEAGAASSDREYGGRRARDLHWTRGEAE